MVMIPVFLTKIKTRDGVTLDGIVVHPRGKKRAALIWIHGLSSRFYSGHTLIRELSSLAAKNGIGYFKFNNRGHDIATQSPRGFLGSGFEKFEDCIHDIRAMIRFARALGYTHIVLAGHSTGANKALYYMYKTRDRRVKGLILAGPVSDVPGEGKWLGRRRYVHTILHARRLAKKYPKRLLPEYHGIFTGQRYLSLYTPGSNEDVFPYHNPNARWKELRSMRIPLAIIFGSRDQYLDRPAKEIMRAFESRAVSTKSFSGSIVKGANHGFVKKEKEVAREIISWINGV